MKSLSKEMNMQRRTLISIAFGAAFLPATTVFGQNFDHNYTAWTALLAKHVKWLPDNKQSRANYKGFAADRAELKSVLDGLSAVSQAQFNGFSKEQQMAFLINAYNAFTVEIILSKYPDIKSIKELGSFNRGPWKNEFSPCWAASATSIGSNTSNCAPNTPNRVCMWPSTAPALAALLFSQKRLLRRRWMRCWKMACASF
ncbi:MAG: DUF547 domain-containing protein [Brachymonas sp.]|nr:DUF547 domain-containing protein [Brachymonas sp.]